MVRWCWVNFQCRASYNLDYSRARAYYTGSRCGWGCCLDIFTLVYPFSPLSPSLWDPARYRLKYCLKGLLNPKPTNNQPNPCIFKEIHVLMMACFAVFVCKFQNVCTQTGLVIYVHMHVHNGGDAENNT